MTSSDAHWTDLAARVELSADGWTFHENPFGPAVEFDVRAETGLVLFSGAALLDGNLAGQPEGLLAVPGTDVSLELLLAKGVVGDPYAVEECAQPVAGLWSGPSEPREQSDAAATGAAATCAVVAASATHRFDSTDLPTCSSPLECS